MVSTQKSVRSSLHAQLMAYLPTRGATRPARNLIYKRNRYAAWSAALALRLKVSRRHTAPLARVLRVTLRRLEKSFALARRARRARCRVVCRAAARVRRVLLPVYPPLSLRSPVLPFRRFASCSCRFPLLSSRVWGSGAGVSLVDWQCVNCLL